MTENIRPSFPMFGNRPADEKKHAANGAVVKPPPAAAASSASSSSAAAGKPKKKTIEEQYTQLDPRDHVRQRPDMYTGVATPTTEYCWVLDADWKPEKDAKTSSSSSSGSAAAMDDDDDDDSGAASRSSPARKSKAKAKKKKNDDDDDGDDDDDDDAMDDGFDDDDDDGSDGEYKEKAKKKKAAAAKKKKADSADGKADSKKSEKKAKGEPKSKSPKKKKPVALPMKRVARMEYRKITYIPALFKIFDEILVNAADNRQRDKNMDKLKVNFDEKTGLISVWNNGKGLPVVMHKDANLYVPEFVFGSLRAGENFDDNDKRTVGGRNGLGAKLTNILSSEFIVETQDRKSGKHFKITFSKGMWERTAPEITPAKKDVEDFTCITFKPDFKYFKMPGGLDADTLALFHRRVYDMAGICNAGCKKGEGLKVYLNGKKIAIDNFKDYVACFIDKTVAEPVHEVVNKEWEVCITASDGDGFAQMSFVNGIDTLEGGTHVDCVADQVVKAVIDECAKKAKGVTVKPAMVKPHLFVFVNALIVNPIFDSQSKRKLKTAKKDFGSDCVLSEKVLKNIVKNSAIVDNVLEIAQVKNNKQLNKSDYKASDKKKIEKLEDATCAGGKLSEKCTIIFTEGDSAKALAMSGLSVVGRKLYGVFPLKGKVVNVRDANVASIAKNKEFANIKKILGLKNGVEYKDTKKLRYGHIMIMTDQDHDGSHIKGLLINMFEHYWPDLLQIKGFLQEFITPIVKVSKKGHETLAFYTIPQYENWKNANADGKGWIIKYYKGLGTSTAKEAKEYFSDLDKHRIPFKWEDEKDNELIDMAFSKKKSDMRKQWIADYKDGDHIDHEDLEHLTYSEFVNKELVLYSIANCDRAIPSMVDGLKTGQRKILFSSFKRNLIREIKVASLAGYVIEQAAYHHGEQSLAGTIIGMAQNYVGSNNINLFVPSGQFGTRTEGGKDAASPRYINTYLSILARAIFSVHDDAILTFLNDDGQKIEPKWYLPILPMALVNGCSGIATGWSTDIPSYNPRDVIDNIRLLLAGVEPKEMTPWYKGFTGAVEKKAKGDGYKVKGVIKKVDDHTLLITDIPIAKTTADYKDFLMKLKDDGVVDAVEDETTDDGIKFTIRTKDDQMSKLEKYKGGLMARFKLEGSVSTSNMVLFTHEGQIKKYANVNQVLMDFFTFRLGHYDRRKASMIAVLNAELNKLDNRTRFILMVVADELKIRNVPKATILKALWGHKFSLIPKAKAKKGDKHAVEVEGAGGPDKDSEADTENEDADGDAEMDEKKAVRTNFAGPMPVPAKLTSGYDYLLSLPLWSITLEKVEELKKQAENKRAELKALEATEPRDMWSSDLDSLVVAMEEYEQFEKDEKELGTAAAKKLKAKAAKNKLQVGAAKSKKGAAAGDDDDDFKPKSKNAKEQSADRAARIKKIQEKTAADIAAAKVANAANKIKVEEAAKKSAALTAALAAAAAADEKKKAAPAAATAASAATKVPLAERKAGGTAMKSEDKPKVSPVKPEMKDLDDDVAAIQISDDEAEPAPKPKSKAKPAAAGRVTPPPSQDVPVRAKRAAALAPKKYTEKEEDDMEEDNPEDEKEEPIDDDKSADDASDYEGSDDEGAKKAKKPAAKPKAKAAPKAAAKSAAAKVEEDEPLSPTPASSPPKKKLVQSALLMAPSLDPFDEARDSPVKKPTASAIEKPAKAALPASTAADSKAAAKPKAAAKKKSDDDDSDAKSAKKKKPAAKKKAAADSDDDGDGEPKKKAAPRKKKTIVTSDDDADDKPKKKAPVKRKAAKDDSGDDEDESATKKRKIAPLSVAQQKKAMKDGDSDDDSTDKKSAAAKKKPAPKKAAAKKKASDDDFESDGEEGSSKTTAASAAASSRPRRAAAADVKYAEKSDNEDDDDEEEEEEVDVSKDADTSAYED